MPNATDIIKTEHRNYIAVLQCLDGVISDVERGNLQPDFALFHLILDYIDGFLDSYHHPREDQFLFRALRERDPESAELLETLENQHQEGYRLLAGLRELLVNYERSQSPSDGKAFFDAFRVYHRLEWNHMRSEEMEVLPRAREHLKEADWAAIDKAFSDHEDPMFGDAPEARFARLLHRIAEMAPAPHGYAPPRG